MECELGVKIDPFSLRCFCWDVLAQQQEKKLRHSECPPMDFREVFILQTIPEAWFPDSKVVLKYAMQSSYHFKYGFQQISQYAQYFLIKKGFMLDNFAGL